MERVINLDLVCTPYKHLRKQPIITKQNKDIQYEKNDSTRGEISE